MPSIVFPTSSSPGLRPQESAGRLINAFVEKTESGAPGQTLWRRSCGLPYAGQGTTVHTRGFQASRDTDQLAPGNRGWATAYWVTNNAVHLLVEASTGEYSVNFIGTLGGEEPVTFGRNHAVEPQVVVCTPEGTFPGTFQLHENAAPTPYVDIDTSLPPNPTSVCAMDGYFVWSYQNGSIIASELNLLEVHADSINIEQGQAVLRVLPFAGRLYAFGDKWTGVYRDAGTQPFPFLREATIPRGIVSTNAVAGWEPGWPNELIWVGDDYIVYKLNGYTPVPLSNDAVSRDIQAAIKNGSRLEAFVYMLGRNAFWVLNAQHPFRPEYTWTWEYNSTTGQWNERRSQGLFNWRGHRSIKGTRDWLIGDQYRSTFYRVKEDYFQEAVTSEDSESPTWTIESGVMSGFPQRTIVPRASFNITSAVGRQPVVGDDDPRVATPTVKIFWSLDGGYTWGNPVVRSIGPIGDARYYPSVICSGLSRGFGIRYRLQVDDAVHIGLAGGEIDVQPRAPI
jgi:hypothetical protein